MEESLMKDKNDLKLLDIMCKWYIWAVVGLVIGNWLSDTLGSRIGLASRKPYRLVYTKKLQ